MTYSIYDVPVQTIEGTDTTLAEYRGKALLIVNVASKCGLTPQYEGLEKLYDSRREEGLAVLGFPANNFGAQEPGTNDEIAEFCSSNFGVRFPMFAKISVQGDDRHALYDQLVEAQPVASATEGSDFREKLAGYGITQDDETDVLWNFEKFLVDRQGHIVGRFQPDTDPNDPLLTAAIDKALA